MTEVPIHWSGGVVSGALYGAGGPPVLLAHGAGSDHSHPRMTGLAQALAAHGLQVMTFNYAYTEAGKKRPDRPEILLEVHRAARDVLVDRAGGPVILAGRSMGGRMGTYLAANREECMGLVLYAYPLHPAGKPDNLRVDHLPDIRRPMLFFQGTGDALSRMELFDVHVRSLELATVEIIEGASHSLDRRPAQTVHLAERTSGWIAAL